MTNVKLPKRLDPIKSAQKRSSYEGVYVASEMLRFNESVDSVLSDVSVKVEFLKDAQSLTYFQGTLAVQVMLVCQRCNQTYPYNVDTEFCFSPVQGSEQAQTLPDAYEPVEVDDHGEVNLFQLLEDEVILSLPIVALHAEEDCSVGKDDMSFGKIEPEPERENPFAVLKELKRD
ncbi:23S rRNA accumulation protein YceD [Glaciecola siphonariae]|uniref:Large ribosomal RNA subunit accumulation protein YceD n=1 Tax=Glaciecola siphonariae TaxID=521012 RepID=A0ABV9LTE7_9ALTE